MVQNPKKHKGKNDEGYEIQLLQASPASTLIYKRTCRSCATTASIFALARAVAKRDIASKWIC
nr:hypothetical protein [Helicobacter macacae]